MLAELASILNAIATFDNPQDFEGWNCGEITTCGRLGNICGGFNVKGGDSDITKTFHLPAGTYSVELDFIKIDSWCVRVHHKRLARGCVFGVDGRLGGGPG